MSDRPNNTIIYKNWTPYWSEREGGSSTWQSKLAQCRKVKLGLVCRNGNLRGIALSFKERKTNGFNCGHRISHFKFLEGEPQDETTQGGGFIGIDSGWSIQGLQHQVGVCLLSGIEFGVHCRRCCNKVATIALLIGAATSGMVYRPP